MRILNDHSPAADFLAVWNFQTVSGVKWFTLARQLRHSLSENSYVGILWRLA
jgi:hypothetical protein